MDDLNGRMLGSKQVAEMLGISVSYAYKIIDQLNRELEQAGYLTLHGKVDSLYLKQRFSQIQQKYRLSMKGVTMAQYKYQVKKASSGWLSLTILIPRLERQNRVQKGL